MTKLKAVENIFDYETVHLLSGGYFIFVNAKLKRDFGPKFKAGDTVPEAHIYNFQLHIVENPGHAAYDNSPEVNFLLQFV